MNQIFFKNLTKIFILFSFLIIPLKVFSASEYEEDSMKEYEPGYAVEETMMLNAYNEPYKYDLRKNYEIETSFSFLIWQPKQKGLNLAVVTPTSDPTYNKAKIVNLHLNYNLGFKAALGIKTRRDNWVIFSEYTHLNSSNKTTKKTTSSSNTISNFWQINNNLSNIIQISGSWHLDLNLLDIALKRTYFVGKKLIFSPHVGINLSWIDQDFKEKGKTENEVHFQTKTSSDSWLLGPKIGIVTKWFFSKNCRFFSNAAVSLFYQNFKLKLEELQLGTPSIIFCKSEKKESAINQETEIETGLGWSSYLDNMKYRIDLSLGYALKIYRNQNTLRSFAEKLKNGSFTSKENLMPHGFTLKAKLDF